MALDFDGGETISRAIGKGVGPENLDFLGPNGTRFVHCHFKAPKKSRFSGPTPSHGLRNRYARIKIILLSTQ